ncbi:MAG: sulfite exporter TauE/SafE family protein [Planctomycetales bacterium]|nr:sulfite exporter TauE/SafE family protein [Planctomycetales bacterium]
MWILVSAVVTASLLGSLHCVGMCGPLAIWASGAGDGRSRSQMVLATSLYHIGRMLTYALAGLIAGAAGQLVDIGGQALGLQLLAARVVGLLMVIFGLLRLGQLLRQGVVARRQATWSPTQPSLMTRLLLRLRPLVFRLPLAARGLVTGLLTALLPCGWLYLFALVAAGTGSMLTGPLVMVAFWLGSVPALVGLVSGTQALAIRFRRLIPAAAALFLIVGGCYTASGRGFAKLNSLADIQLQGPVEFTAQATDSGQGEADSVAEGISRLVQTPLPCCLEHAATADKLAPGEVAP